MKSIWVVLAILMAPSCLWAETLDGPPNPTEEICYELPTTLVCWNGDRVLVWDTMKHRHIARMNSTRFQVSLPKEGASKSYRNTAAFVLGDSKRLVVHNGAAYLFADQHRYNFASVDHARVIFFDQSIFVVVFVDASGYVKQIFCSTEGAHSMVELAYPRSKVMWYELTSFMKAFYNNVTLVPDLGSFDHEMDWRGWYTSRRPFTEDGDSTTEGRRRLAEARDHLFALEPTGRSGTYHIDHSRPRLNPTPPQHVITLDSLQSETVAERQVMNLDGQGLSLHWMDDGRLLVKSTDPDIADFAIPAPTAGLVWPSHVSVLANEAEDPSQRKIRILWTNGQTRDYPLKSLLNEDTRCGDLISQRGQRAQGSD